LKFYTFSDNFDQKNCPEIVRRSYMAISKKANSKLWESKVFQYNPQDKAALYYAKFRYAGRRSTFCTHTTIRAQAAAVAKTIFMELRTLGWDATLKKRKPELPSRCATTVGEFLDAIRKTYSGQERTISDYCRNFRRLAADIFKIERDEKKFDYFNGGRLKWIEKVNKIRLAEMTPELIQAWRVAYVGKGDDDLQKRRSAQASANSILRQCRSLFGRKRLELISFDPPIDSPFRKIRLDPEGDMRYRSAVDVTRLMREALQELGDKPQMLKAFLLSICAGLRRNELDKLEWSAFNWKLGTIHIGPTRYLHVKSQKSIGDVDLDPEISALFRGYYARRQSDFVLESEIEPRPRAGYSHYRAANVFGALTTWLREKGIRSRTPIHTLRKEFGSMIAQQYGIHAASAALRHADIGITSRHYVGKKQRTAVGLGYLLTQAEKVRSMSTDAPLEGAA
jgi:integrase